jgi:hypothetical protein
MDIKVFTSKLINRTTCFVDHNRSMFLFSVAQLEHINPELDDIVNSILVDVQEIELSSIELNNEGRVYKRFNIKLDKIFKSHMAAILNIEIEELVKFAIIDLFIKMYDKTCEFLLDSYDPCMDCDNNDCPAYNDITVIDVDEGDYEYE